jgi:hypothetical protein
MTGPALLAALRSRGVVLYRDGDRLRYRALPGAYTATDRTAVAAHRDELLRLLRDAAALEADGTAARLRQLHAGLTAEERASLDAEARDGNPLAHLVLEAVASRDAEPVAWRLHSRRLGCELWVVRDTEALPGLLADGALGDLPVVLADELPDLRGRDDEDLRRLLTGKVVFGPLTRLSDLEGEHQS